MTKYIVKWTKEFVSGNLEGITYDTELEFNSLDSATRYMGFLHEHRDKPVIAFGGSHYLCHMARIESEE